MKRSLAVLALVVLAATPATAARRRVVEHPITLGPCTPGVVVLNYFSDDLGVDSSYVYFGDDEDGVFRVKKDGTELTRLATIPDGGSFALLALDDQNLYFFSDDIAAGSFTGNLYSLPKSGGAPKQLASGISLAYDLRVDATAIYWTSLGTTVDLETLNSDGKVEKINKDGTGRVLLASGLSGATAVAVDDTNVWFGEAGLAVGNVSSGLRRVPKSGGSVTHVTDGASVVSIDLTSSDVWFSTGDVNSSNGALMRAPKSGGTPATIFSGNVTPLALHIAGSTVYYIASGDEDETITSIPLAGGTPASLKVVDFWSEALAIDDCSIYYPSGTGIERIAR